MNSCEQCGEAFPRRGPKRFCNRTCRHAGRHQRRMHQVSCGRCGRSFLTAKGSYCSLACRPNDADAASRRPIRDARRQVRVIDARLRKERRRLTVAPPRSCARCGLIGIPRLRQFCSEACMRQRPRWSWPRVFDRSCTTCARRFVTLGINALYCSNRCRKRAGKHSLSETRRRRAGDTIRRRRPAVIATWGMWCHLCGEPIPAGLPDNDPLALTMDHVVPQSAGGTHALDNLRPAHRRCNYRRQDLPLEAWRESRIVSTVREELRAGVLAGPHGPMAMVPPHG
jgi:hypothetical protein